MAKISNKSVYVPKQELSLKDYFVITDSENFKRTKTVESKIVLNFINKSNGNSNSIFTFSNVQNDDFNLTTPGYFFSKDNQVDPELATKLYFNFRNLFGDNVFEIFTAIVNSGIVVIKMVNTNDYTNYLYIQPSDIVLHEEYFEFDVSLINELSKGIFEDKDSYVLHFELFGGQVSDDSKLDRAEYTGTATTLDEKINSTKQYLENRADDFEYQVEQVLLPQKADQLTTYTKIEVNNLDAALVAALKDGVNPSGDTLQKLYNLIQGVAAEIQVNTIAERNALNVDQGDNVFVVDDGDGKWALYKATTTGVNANYVKLSDPDLLNALMSSSQIKIAYESNPDTNAFTNALLAKLSAVDQNVSILEKQNWNSKLDRGGYTGTAKDLDDKINLINLPDEVTKDGIVTINGLNISIGQNEFNWRINTVEFTNTPAFTATLDPSPNNFFRSDLLQGNNIGQYSIKKGIEGEFSSTAPEADVNHIALRVINIQGSNVAAPVPLPDFNALYFKRFKQTFKTSQAVFDINPNEDDYNIIFTNTAQSVVKIYPNGSFGKFIKNNSTHPLKSIGTGNVIVQAEPGVILRAPNGLVLNKNQQCYLIKDDTNEWTLINPVADLTEYIDGTREDVMTRIDDAFESIDQVDAKINNYFKGVYLTEAALMAALPTANIGDYAQVNQVGADDVVNYNWDNEENVWVKNAVAGSGATNTDQLPEGSTNLYFTVSRFLANLTYANIIAALGFTPSTAPNNAQKNSDITKAEIEAKLTGEITSHTHPNTGGDMTTNTPQSVSAVKTFLNGMLGLRNVANTFTSFLANSNTASRTYTLQNRNGTLADLSDIAAVNTNKMDVPTGGLLNYLPKFLTATTQGRSRVVDNGTYVGIDTVVAPTKDITLGYQGNREIGIEVSDSSTVGRDLTISAGKTINYQLSAEFLSLNTLIASYYGLAVAPNGDVYATTGIKIYKRTGGVGSFVDIAQINRSWYGIAAAPNGDIFAVVYGGDIYKQASGSSIFVSLSQGNRNWYGITVAPNGDVYATVQNGDIYKQTAGVGNFLALAQVTRNWTGIAAAPNGDIFAVVYGGDIYKQTGGIGNFVGIGTVSRGWYGITVAPNGNLYANAEPGYTYIQINSTGALIQCTSLFLGNRCLASDSTSSIYLGANSSSIYFLNNNALGVSNLDGGTLKHVAGTGKGTGKSRYQIATGQKTTSGTDMQVETVRIEVDETGAVLLLTDKIYADNAAAISGGERQRTIYWTPTGEMRIVI